MAGSVLEGFLSVLRGGHEVLWIFLGRLGGCAQGRVRRVHKAHSPMGGPVCPGAVLLQQQSQGCGGLKEKVPKVGRAWASGGGGCGWCGRL